VHTPEDYFAWPEATVVKKVAKVAKWEVRMRGGTTLTLTREDIFKPEK
jgi:hypothetical protein